MCDKYCVYVSSHAIHLMTKQLVLYLIINVFVVGAILEYEGIQGLSSKPAMSRTRSSSHGDVLDEPLSPEKCFENLVKMVSV